MTTNKNIKMSSTTSKSSENFQKKEGGPDRSVSDNQSSSVTLNELVMKDRKNTVIFVNTLTSIYKRNLGRYNTYRDHSNRTL